MPLDRKEVYEYFMPLWKMWCKKADEWLDAGDLDSELMKTGAMLMLVAKVSAMEDATDAIEKAIVPKESEGVSAMSVSFLLADIRDRLESIETAINAVLP